MDLMSISDSASHLSRFLILSFWTGVVSSPVEDASFDDEVMLVSAAIVPAPACMPPGDGFNVKARKIDIVAMT